MQFSKALEKKIRELIYTQKKIHTIFVHTYSGETQKEAIEKYKKNSKNKFIEDDFAVIIEVIDRKVIEERSKKNVVG